MATVNGFPKQNIATKIFRYQISAFHNLVIAKQKHVITRNTGNTKWKPRKIHKKSSSKP